MRAGVRLIGALLVLTGCGALSVPSVRDAGEREDATPLDSGATSHDSGAGALDAGGSLDAGIISLDAGGVVDAGGALDASVISLDAGSLDAGVISLDAGDSLDAGGALDAGSTGPFVASAVTLQRTLSGNTVLALAGREGEVYAVTELELLRSTGGTFTSVPLTSLTGSAPSMRSVYVTDDGAVFVLAQREVFWCKSGCATGGTAFSSAQLAANDDGVSLCGQSKNRVFAVFMDRNDFNRTMLWDYDGDIWRNTSINLGLSDPGDCSVTASGELIVPARGGVILYDHHTGSSTVVHPDVPPLSTGEAAGQYWFTSAVLGDEVWALGDFRRSVHRGADGGWALFNPNEASSKHYAVALISANEIYGAGGTTPQTALRKFDGVSWSNGPSLAGVAHVKAAFVAGPNVIYFGGSQGLNPVIDRLTR